MPLNHVDRALVYVAGPFTSNPIVGTRKAVDIAERLDATGVISPLIPHFNLLWDYIHPHTNEFWMSHDMSLLNRCDALFRMPGISPGADEECEFAEANSIEVYYEIDDLIAWAESFIATR